MTQDVLELYRWAVQDPETHAMVLQVMYERTRPGQTAKVLREDFAGTSAESIAWAALDSQRTAIAVDLDGTTLAWARQRGERLLGTRVAQVTFIEGDALTTGVEQGAVAADITSVLNFSIYYLREPATLASYLAHAREVMAPSGILVMNLFGGPDSVAIGTTHTRVDRSPRLSTERGIAPFDYQWEVRAFDPTTRALECRIHFVVDGRELRDAFSYQWQLWSIDELLAACKTAGFASAQLWRHTYDPAKGAAGVFLGPVEASAVESLPQWTAYIVAAR